MELDFFKRTYKCKFNSMVCVQMCVRMKGGGDFSLVTDEYQSVTLGGCCSCH